MKEISLADCAARLEAAEAQLALIQLEAEYARSWDAADSDAWAGLFSPDGVFDMAAVGHQPGAVYRGYAELRGFCEQVSAIYAGLHFMHLPKIVLDRDRARARIHFQWFGIVHAGVAHSGQRTAAGYYDVDYVRSDTHGWRISRRMEKAVTGRVEESFDLYANPNI